MNMKLRSLVELGLLVGNAACASLGCSAHTTLGDDGTAGSSMNDPGGSAGIAGTAADAADTSSGGAAGAPPAALELAPPTNTCPSTCEEAAGTVETPTTVEEFYRHLMGRWRICSGGANTFQKPGDDVVGVEYEAPTLVETPYDQTIWQGNMYYLVEGAAGLERGKGFGYQLTYDVDPQDGSATRWLNMHPRKDPTSFIVAMFQYSPCPRQWLITGQAAEDRGAMLVPVE